LGVIRERVEQIYRALYDKIEPITVPMMDERKVRKVDSFVAGCG
jgi:hypothetical protein